MDRDMHEGPVPAYMQSFVRRQEDVCKASLKLAGFVNLFKQVKNPDSKFYQSPGRDYDYLSGGNKFFAEMQSEATRYEEDPYHPSRGTKVGLTWIQKIIDETMSILPEPVSYDEAHSTVWFHGESEPEAQFGERLIQRLHNEIVMAFPDSKSKIRQFLEIEMVRRGLCTGEDLQIAKEEDFTARGVAKANLGDVRKTKANETVKTLLCIPRARSKSEEAEFWQSVLVKGLVERYPDRYDPLVLSTPDKVIPVGVVSDALESLPEQMKQEAFRIEEYGTVPLVTPYVTARKRGVGLSHALFGTQLDEFNKPESGRFLMTLAIPGALPLVCAKLWEGTPKDSTESSLILSGKSKSGIAMTTIQLGDHMNAGKEMVPSYFHVVHFKSNLKDKQKEELLVVGDMEIDKKLQRQLYDQGVTYISRSDKNASETLEKRLNDFISKTPPAQANDLSVFMRRAFRGINVPTEEFKKKQGKKTDNEEQLLSKYSLSQLMLDTSITHPDPLLVRMLVELDDNAIEALRAQHGNTVATRGGMR